MIVLSAFALLAATIVAVSCTGGGVQVRSTPAAPTPAVGDRGEGTPAEVGYRPYHNRTYGYGLTLPPGWVVDERNLKGVAVRQTQKGFVVAMAIYGSDDLPPAPATLVGFREAWIKVMRDIMPAFTVLKEEPRALGQDDALSYEYTWVDRGTKLWAKALLVRRPNYGYEIFGWVPESAWVEFQRAFDEIVATFKLE